MTHNKRPEVSGEWEKPWARNKNLLVKEALSRATRLHCHSRVCNTHWLLCYLLSRRGGGGGGFKWKKERAKLHVLLITQLPQYPTACWCGAWHSTSLLIICNKQKKDQGSISEDHGSMFKHNQWDQTDHKERRIIGTMSGDDRGNYHNFKSKFPS